MDRTLYVTRTVSEYINRINEYPIGFFCERTADELGLDRLGRAECVAWDIQKMLCCERIFCSKIPPRIESVYFGVSERALGVSAKDFERLIKKENKEKSRSPEEYINRINSVLMDYARTTYPEEYLDSLCGNGRAPGRRRFGKHHKVKYIEDMTIFEKTGIHEYPFLTNGREYEVICMLEFQKGQPGYLIYDDDCYEYRAKPYNLDLFEPVFYPCPCCGRHTLETRNNYDICETCFWEDEYRCEERPDEESAANGGLSLNQYRAKWIEDKKRGVYDLYTSQRASSYNHYHREELENDNVCGCYYCETIFAPSEITEWCRESLRGEARTAICPHCGIDTVIGESSGYPITPEFLKSMHKFAF